MCWIDRRFAFDADHDTDAQTPTIIYKLYLLFSHESTELMTSTLASQFLRQALTPGAHMITARFVASNSRISRDSSLLPSGTLSNGDFTSPGDVGNLLCVSVCAGELRLAASIRCHISSNSLFLLHYRQEPPLRIPHQSARRRPCKCASRQTPRRPSTSRTAQTLKSLSPRLPYVNRTTSSSMTLVPVTRSSKSARARTSSRHHPYPKPSR